MNTYRNNINILFSVLLSFLMFSCQKDENTIEVMTPETNQSDMTLPTSLLVKGNFTGQNGYPAQGTVQVLKDAKDIYFVSLLDDFSTSFATGSVTIYLSKNPKLSLSTADSFIKLGVLNKNGAANFKLESLYNESFQHVIVWCAPASIQFGVAALTK